MLANPIVVMISITICIGIAYAGTKLGPITEPITKVLIPNKKELPTINSKKWPLGLIILFVYSKSIYFLDIENLGSILFKNTPAPKLGKKLVIENISAKATNLKPANRLNIMPMNLIRFPKIIYDICSKCIRFKPLSTFL